MIGFICSFSSFSPLLILSLLPFSLLFFLSLFSFLYLLLSDATYFFFEISPPFINSSFCHCISKSQPLASILTLCNTFTTPDLISSRSILECPCHPRLSFPTGLATFFIFYLFFFIYFSPVFSPWVFLALCRLFL
jgi:hypothetical protein